MATGQRKDPYKNFMFLVEIDGIARAGFQEAKIPESAQEVIEYREGSEAATPRKLSGLARYDNVVLKRGVTDSLDLYNWRKAVEDGQIAKSRKNMSIVVLNDEGQPAARWEFTQAWPIRYVAPELRATATEVAVETIEIAHEGMKRTQ
jgi:phage tail-like protein